jgi:hypothetical protein
LPDTTEIKRSRIQFDIKDVDPPVRVTIDAIYQTVHAYKEFLAGCGSDYTVIPEKKEILFSTPRIEILNPKLITPVNVNTIE